MTSNQIAYQRNKEEMRKNREAERQKDIQLAIDKKKADAASVQAIAGARKSQAEALEAIERMAAGYEPGWGKLFGDITKGIGAIIPF